MVCAKSRLVGLGIETDKAGSVKRIEISRVKGKWQGMRLAMKWQAMGLATEWRSRNREWIIKSGREQSDSIY